MTGSRPALPSRTVAFMLSNMESAGTLVTAARKRAGLSMRALSSRAGVAYTTVSRIEHGQVDPTAGMLRRLLAAAGQELVLSMKQSQSPRLADLVDAWHVAKSGQHRPDWTRLRAFLDHLALHPEDRGPATLRMPAPSGSEMMDNLLAAMAEKICDDAGIPRPSWTRRIPPLRQPWETPSTPIMREAAHAATPPQLLNRHFILTGDSLWRDQATVGI
jgi:transcriptional regulator with XRE-family HTH domain